MMMSKILPVIFAAAFLFVQISAAAENDPVIARAGDYVIKKSDMERIIGYYSPDRQKYLQDNPAQKVTLIRRVLEVRIISSLAKQEGFDKKPDIKEQLEYTMDDFIAKEYLNKAVAKDIKVSDEDVRLYYEANKEKFKAPEQVRVRHILVHVSSKASDEEKKKAKEKIMALHERAIKGEDFAKLASEYSDDLGTKKKGGDTDYFAKGKMVKPFEEAAFSLKPGQISGVVETKFGYHIIKAEDHREARTMGLEEVKAAIRDHLRNEQINSKAAAFIQNASSKAGMEIYEDKITGTAQDK
jgi:peptidyl-prolyl cis-trans isomerase C